MASRPYFDGRGWWLCKFRPDPVGEWKVARLCKHPGPWSKARPPRKPPKLAEDRQREFADIEYRARHGLAAAAAGPKGLEGYVARYLDLYRVAQRPGSVRQMERHARSFLAFARARGIATVQAVGKADVRDYLEMRFGKGASHGTLRTEWGYLAGIWSRAVEDGLVAASPWTGVRPPGKPAEPGWTLWTPDEIERIAAAMGKPWQRDFVRVLGHTGFRLSTGLALAWDWIDWRRGTVTIPAGPEIKTRYLHVLGDEARAVLERRQVEAGKSDLVFPNPLRREGRPGGHRAGRAPPRRREGRGPAGDAPRPPALLRAEPRPRRGADHGRLAAARACVPRHDDAVHDGRPGERPGGAGAGPAQPPLRKARTLARS
jgi:integrase